MHARYACVPYIITSLTVIVVYMYVHIFQEKVPLAWVNIALIDYKNRLRSGEKKLYCWPAGNNISLEEDLNLIGGVTTNPDTHDAPYLVLKFRDYNSVPIVYPPMEKVCVNTHIFLSIFYFMVIVKSCGVDNFACCLLCS